MLETIEENGEDSKTTLLFKNELKSGDSRETQDNRQELLRLVLLLRPFLSQNL